MNNTSDIKAPAISTTDPDGVVWTFDPAAQKWTGVVQGKKFSSKDYSTVREKVSGHLAEIKHKQDPEITKKVELPATPTLIEIGLLAVKNSDNGGNNGHDPLNHRLKIEPVIVKVEWDATKGEINIVRYKETEQKDSGWKSWRAGEMLLVHPNFMTAEMRRVFERFFEGRVLRQAYINAEKEISQAWWGAKTEDRTKWRMGRDGYENELKPTYDRHSTHSSMVSQSWPLTVPPKLEDMSFSEWKQQDDGSLKKGEVIVRMERDTNSYRSQDLSFNVYIPGREDPVFSERDLHASLFIGNASHDMLNNAIEQPVETWQGSDGWEIEAKQKSWPVKMEVYSAAIVPKKDLHRSAVYPFSFFYGRTVGNALGEKKEAATSGRESLAVVMWHPVSSGWGGTTFRAVGPEDCVLARITELKKNFAELATERNLQPIKSQDMKDIFQGTLTELYNAVVDGEEIDKEPAAAKKVLENMMRTMEQKTLARESTQAWAKECSDTVEAVKSDLAGIQIAPAAKPPKPR